MYRIDEEIEKEEYTLLIPGMMDMHFPLLRYAFYSKKYRPVILEETEGIAELGLRYVSEGLCCPVILMAGQFVKALQSGSYDVNRTVVLAPQILNGCQGNNYAAVIRRALDRAGFSAVPVLSLNRTASENRLSITTDLLLRAVAAIYYGDLLMILVNQIEPYEKNPGETRRFLARWTEILSEDLKEGKQLGKKDIKKRFTEIVQDFCRIERNNPDSKKVGVVGEFYIKYNSIVNGNLEQYLREENCEYYVNGITWYALYYMDTHLLPKGNRTGLKALVGHYHTLFRHFLELQGEMVEKLRGQGFYCMDSYDDFKERASCYVNYGCSAGDGWLIGAEFVNHALNGYDRIICGQPLHCLASSVCGRGVYEAMGKKFPEAQYISVDYDTQSVSTDVKNRVRMLLSL